MSDIDFTFVYRPAVWGRKSSKNVYLNIHFTLLFAQRAYQVEEIANNAQKYCANKETDRKILHIGINSDHCSETSSLPCTLHDTHTGIALTKFSFLALFFFAPLCEEQEEPYLQGMMPSR